MAPFTADVPVRWSDMDAYGHVNHARTVTLLEDARTELFFLHAEANGAGTLRNGLVVVRLSMHYRAPLVYSGTPVRVRLWVSELRAASFTVDYVVHDGVTGQPAVTASTQLAPYEVASGKPRRLAAGEREWLAGYRVDGATRG